MTIWNVFYPQSLLENKRDLMTMMLGSATVFFNLSAENKMASLPMITAYVPGFVICLFLSTTFLKIQYMKRKQKTVRFQPKARRLSSVHV